MNEVKVSPFDLLMVGLQVLFIGLKLAGAIAWPWPLVLAPAIAYLALVALLTAVLVVIKLGDR